MITQLLERSSIQNASARRRRPAGSFAPDAQSCRYPRALGPWPWGLLLPDALEPILVCGSDVQRENQLRILPKYSKADLSGGN